MERQTDLLLLQILQKLTADGKETDLSKLTALSTLPAGTVRAWLQEALQKDYVSAMELDLCCGVDYILYGLSEEGKQYLAALEQEA